MNGFLLTGCLVIMIALMMVVQRWVFPYFGIENNKSSRAVMCFIVIAGALAMQEWALQ
ncbi:hypothetical protein [Moraxella sp. ZY210820]|uniref:hypothetical protein n=1 Tax=unclassified Moraxella TaxID=2685852 RepID=UPI0027313602|nr:hypothetical protein [Moraxella sp. ZY210820]WLF84166.1 hypothetical protein LU301_01300 [Moraxella sp. ZY210820]